MCSLWTDVSLTSHHISVWAFGSFCSQALQCLAFYCLKGLILLLTIALAHTIFFFFLFLVVCVHICSCHLLLSHGRKPCLSYECQVCRLPLFGWNMAICDNSQVLCPWPLHLSKHQASSYWQSGLTILLQGAAKEWSCRAWNSGWPCAHTCLDAILCLLLWVSIVGIVRLVCTWSQERLSQGTNSLRCATGFSCLLN